MQTALSFTEDGSYTPPKKPYRVVRSSSQIISTKSYPILEPVERIKFIIPCLFGFAPWCWTRKRTRPVIQFFANAVKVKDLHIFLLTGVVEGEVSTRFRNESTPGTTSLENRKTGEITEPQPVEESATLDGDTEETLFLKDVNTTLVEIRRSVSNLRPQVERTVDTHFRKTGLVAIIKTILDLLLKGAVYVDDDIEMTVSYVWAGKKNIITKTFKYEAYLPVGKVNWHVW